MSRTHPQRIVFIGAECTGKSTITRAIADHFKEPWSSEYVRQHVEQLDRPLDATDLDPIAKGQIRLEDESAQNAKRWVFHDTNLLSSILYAEHYFNTHLKWVDEVFEQRNYSHYFLCEPDIPWEADPGQREGPQTRSELQSLFEQILTRYSIPFIRLSGSLEDRTQRVLSILRD